MQIILQSYVTACSVVALDNRGTVVRFPTWEGFFSSRKYSDQLRVPSSPAVHWVPGVMRPRRDADHLHILPKLRMKAAILSFRQGSSWRLQGQRYQRLIREVVQCYIRDQSPRSWFDSRF
jgi:hypothetical protein